MDSIKLEDGTTATTGDRVFNYYDRYPVTIAGIDGEGWCYTTRDDGSRGPSLNGARMCSLAFAVRKGWLSAPVEDAPMPAPVEDVARTVFACPAHAPMLFSPLAYDDGAPSCSVAGCGARNYAVKPFILTGAGAVEGWWRTTTGERVNVATAPVEDVEDTTTTTTYTARVTDPFRATYNANGFTTFLAAVNAMRDAVANGIAVVAPGTGIDVLTNDGARWVVIAHNVAVVADNPIM